MVTVDSEKYTALARENQKLKAENQQLKMSWAIEKAFFEAGGKRSSALDDFSFFDLVQGHASKFIKIDAQGKLIIIDSRDDTRLKTDAGENYSLRDLINKFKKSGLSPLTDCFDTNGNSVTPSFAQNLGDYSDRESLREIKDPAARLSCARELGIK